jgi:hypothetical protein
MAGIFRLAGSGQGSISHAGTEAIPGYVRQISPTDGPQQSRGDANSVVGCSTTNREELVTLILIPVTFKQACDFVMALHRHNKPPRGHKFSIGVCNGQDLVGVAMVGRPIARAFDDGFTAEINRTCTNGYSNANSKLYGAARAACKAMGYRRVITYTQASESGASLRAAGFVRVRDIAARKGWAASSQKLRYLRDPVGTGGVDRVLWEIVFDSYKEGTGNGL